MDYEYIDDDGYYDDYSDIDTSDWVIPEHMLDTGAGSAISDFDMFVFVVIAIVFGWLVYRIARNIGDGDDGGSREYIDTGAGTGEH